MVIVLIVMQDIMVEIAIEMAIKVLPLLSTQLFGNELLFGLKGIV